LRTKIISSICFLAFVGGFFVWGVAEKRRESVSPSKEIRIPPNSKWNPAEVFYARYRMKQIQAPFPKEIVTEVKSGDTFILSSGKKVKLVGIALETGDSQIKKEAEDLANRLVAKHEVFLEFETNYKKDEGSDYAYLYFRIPIIPSQPPVGPEYVHWSLNAELLKLGYARVNASIPFKHLDKFRQYEREAKIQRRGLWKTP